jgi:hypothetical protein
MAFPKKVKGKIGDVGFQPKTVAPSRQIPLIFNSLTVESWMADQVAIYQ